MAATQADAAASSDVIVSAGEGVTSNSTIFVKGLAPETNKQTLSDAFAKFGSVKGARCRTSRGFGFVEFAKREEMLAAVAASTLQIDGAEAGIEECNTERKKKKKKGKAKQPAAAEGLQEEHGNDKRGEGRNRKRKDAAAKAPAPEEGSGETGNGENQDKKKKKNAREEGTRRSLRTTQEGPRLRNVRDGQVSRLPFPSCLNRIIIKLGAKPCQHPGLVDDTFLGPGVDVAIAYSVPNMQLIVSADASGSELDTLDLGSSSGSAAPERYVGVPIQHATYCSAAQLDDAQALATAASDAGSSRAIRAAVNILVINEHGQVLLTRRGKTMRAFPGFWVLPGGHVDPSERLCDAAAREVLEETGLEVSAAECKVLCAWESCFPIKLEHGPPKVQHIVLYFEAPLRGGTPKMQPVEVEAYAWLDVAQVRKLCRKQFEEHEAVDAMHSEEGGAGTAAKVEIAEIANNMAEGTRYTLSRWSAEGREARGGK